MRDVSTFPTLADWDAHIRHNGGRMLASVACDVPGCRVCAHAHHGRAEGR